MNNLTSLNLNFDCQSIGYLGTDKLTDTIRSQLLKLESITLNLDRNNLRNDCFVKLFKCF